MMTLRTYTIAAALLVVATALLSGCQLAHPGWSSLAFVEVKGVPIDRVREATLQVFTAERYSVRSSNRQGLIFVREGTTNDRLQYARYQESLEMRVEVTLENYGEDGVLVRADAFAVSSGGTHQNETRLLRIARRPYMQLLERVKDKAQASLEQEAK